MDIQATSTRFKSHIPSVDAKLMRSMAKQNLVAGVLDLFSALLQVLARPVHRVARGNDEQHRENERYFDELLHQTHVGLLHFGTRRPQVTLASATRNPKTNSVPEPTFGENPADELQRSDTLSY